MKHKYEKRYRMKDYLKSQNQSGLSLIAAVLALMIFSLFIAVAVSLVTTGANIGLQEEQGMQAFYIAEGGIERVLDAFYNNKIGCNNSLAYNLISLGAGTFTTSVALINPLPSTTLRVMIGNGPITYIQVLSTAGYETAGRIWIDSEQIIYTGISAVAADCGGTAPCFTGITRGVDGTTANTHAAGATVNQKQCRIQSTGTITSNPLANPTQRVVETGVPAMAADFLDGGSVSVGTNPGSPTTIGSLSTQLGAGDNLIIAVISFQNTSATSTITAGHLVLSRGGTSISNDLLIKLGGGANPTNTTFPRDTQFLLFRDAGAPANPTYNITAYATSAGISAEVKMIVINNAPNSSFLDGAPIYLQNTTTTVLSHSPTLPAGDNIIIAAIQLQNTDGGAIRNILAGNLRLNRGAAILSSNEFDINLDRSNQVNVGTGILLLAKDTGAPANPNYTITGIANRNDDIYAEAKIIVLNGLQSAFITTPAPGYVSIGTTETVIGSLATTFPAGENVVLASTQFWNSAGGIRRIFTGNESIVLSGTSESSNEYPVSICASGTRECDDFADGLLWHHLRADSNPTYEVRAIVDPVNTGIRGEAKILAIHIKNKIPIYRKENY